MDQLDSLILFIGLEKEQEGGGYDVLGHSWGGMLAMRWVARRQPRGLRRLVVSNSPASMELFVKGALKLREKLPEDIRVSTSDPLAYLSTSAADYDYLIILAYVECVELA